MSFGWGLFFFYFYLFYFVFIYLFTEFRYWCKVFASLFLRKIVVVVVVVVAVEVVVVVVVILVVVENPTKNVQIPRNTLNKKKNLELISKW